MEKKTISQAIEYLEETLMNCREVERLTNRPIKKTAIVERGIEQYGRKLINPDYKIDADVLELILESIEDRRDALHLSNTQGAMPVDVRLSVEEKEIKPSTKKITLVYENRSDKPYSYDDSFMLEDLDQALVYTSEKEAKLKEYPLPAGASGRLTLNIRKLFGPLKAGRYRLNGSLWDHLGRPCFLSVDFTVGS